MPGANLIRRDVAVIGGGLPELAEAISSRYAESVYIRYGSLADIGQPTRDVRLPPKLDMFSVELDVCFVP
jgi:hypothetical protein